MVINMIYMININTEIGKFSIEVQKFEGFQAL